MADLISDSYVQGREQRRLLFEQEEETKELKEKSMKDHVMHALVHR